MNIILKGIGRMKSQPSWAAWIEIIPYNDIIYLNTGRSPLGLRGLKSTSNKIASVSALVAALLGCVD